MTRSFWYYIGAVCSCLVICATILYFSFLDAPDEFPYPSVFEVKTGSPVAEIGEQLQADGAVHSQEVFTFLVRILNPDSGALAGSYALDVPENVFQLSYRIAHGQTGIQPVSVTVPEGMYSREIADVIRVRIPEFDAETFVSLAKSREGYLFPETYLFSPDVTPEQVIAAMTKTFEEHIEPFSEEILASGKTLHEIVTMASILEREARKLETKKIVSGILWERIKIGMALQVDAVFGYILNKSGYAPSFDDLKIDSPYNTYVHRGLPPGPISNPGLESIQAALEPTPSPYLYYLTGADGAMYYAETFDKHVANRKYLK